MTYEAAVADTNVAVVTVAATVTAVDVADDVVIPLVAILSAVAVVIVYMADVGLRLQVIWLLWLLL